MITLAVGTVAILEVISEIPAIVDGIATLASTLKGGRRESEDIEKLRADSNKAKEKLKKFGIIGHCIRDYSKLSGLSTYNNNRVDFILKSVIPKVTMAGDQEAIMLERKNTLKEEYERVREVFSGELFKYFIVKRYIDGEDIGELKTLIGQIDNALVKGEGHIDHEEYKKLEDILKKEVSNKLSSISGLCTIKIDNITERLIAYEFQIP